MTEDQIELKAEKAMDRLDAKLMAGELSQAEYDHEVMILDKWVQQQLAEGQDRESYSDDQDRESYYTA